VIEALLKLICSRRRYNIRDGAEATVNEDGYLSLLVLHFSMIVTGSCISVLTA
jgi:hypothetical protein